MPGNTAFLNIVKILVRSGLLAVAIVICLCCIRMRRTGSGWKQALSSLSYKRARSVLPPAPRRRKPPVLHSDYDSHSEPSSSYSSSFSDTSFNLLDTIAPAPTLALEATSMPTPVSVPGRESKTKRKYTNRKTWNEELEKALQVFKHFPYLHPMQVRPELINAACIDLQESSCGKKAWISLGQQG